MMVEVTYIWLKLPFEGGVSGGKMRQNQIVRLNKQGLGSDKNDGHQRPQGRQKQSTGK